MIYLEDIQMKIKLRFKKHPTGTIYLIVADKYADNGKLIDSESVGYVLQKKYKDAITFSEIKYDKVEE